MDSDQLESRVEDLERQLSALSEECGESCASEIRTLRTENARLRALLGEARDTMVFCSGSCDPLGKVKARIDAALDTDDGDE